MFDLVRLSKLRIAALRDGVIGLGEANIVGTGFIEGRAKDATQDCLQAVATAVLQAPAGYIEVSVEGKPYIIMVASAGVELELIPSEQTDGKAAND